MPREHGSADSLAVEFDEVELREDSQQPSRQGRRSGLRAIPSQGRLESLALRAPPVAERPIEPGKRSTQFVLLLVYVKGKA